MKNTTTLRAVTIRSVWRNPIHFIGFGFGSGLAPIMPGTFGTLAAIPIYLLMTHLQLWSYIILTAIFTILSVFICHITSRDIGVHDYTPIVLDEIVGYLVTMIAAPIGWFWVIFGFLLFRVFDIWKPWPIRWLDEHVHGGLGIVIDDLVAAIYSWIVLQLIAFIWIYYQ